MVFLFLLLAIAMLTIHILAKNKYIDVVEPISKKEYQLKKLIPIGLFILDIFKYKFNTEYDKKLLSKLGEIYGAKSAAQYLKIHWANKIILIFIILMLSSLVAVSLQGGEVIPEFLRLSDNTIQRPAFGEGDRKINLLATFKSGKEKTTEEVSLNIKELPPKDQEAIAAAKARLTTKLILGKNTNANQITTSLNLIKEISDLGVAISWQSSNPEVIDVGGRLIDRRSGEEVILTATLSKGRVSDTKAFQITLLDTNSSEAQAISFKDEAVKILAAQLEDNSHNAEILLPSKLKENNGIQVIWSYPIEKESSILSFLMILLAVIVGIVYALNNELNKKLRKRHLSIQTDFPDFLNKFVLLINAGMNVSRAWEKIVLEANRDRPLYNELRLTYGEITGGKPQLQAYEDFANRCKTTEITKFVSTLIQNIKKGDAEMIHILKLQAVECWNLRKSVAKQLGEEASTKLLFPMMIMFLAILLIILTPAILTLSSM